MAFREEASRETGSGNCDESVGRGVSIAWSTSDGASRNQLYEDKEIIKELRSSHLRSGAIFRESVSLNATRVAFNRACSFLNTCT